MRRANDSKVVENAAGEIYAIDLGADFCSEHEWGVKRLRSNMGIPEDQDRNGLDYHTAKVSGNHLLLSFVSKGNHFIVFDPMVAWDKREGGDALKKEKSRYADHRELSIIKPWRKEDKPKDLAAAWDEGSFGIIISETAPDKVKEFGKKLAKAIETGDFAVWFGGTGGNPFARSGLVVAITSLVPQDVKDYMVEAYADQKRLEKAAEDTGVTKLLAEKGKKYYACSPRWLDDKKSEVRFWLNPQEQQIHNYGWFSAQDLIDWANGVSGNKIDMVKKPEKLNA